MSQESLFSCKFTVLLSFILFVPFILKILNSELEPYPAIILPSGAGKININSKFIEVNNLSIYGYKQGKLQRLDPESFLKPIPSQYIHSIAKNEFGLYKKQQENLHLKILRKKLKLKRKFINFKNQKLAKIWLSKKLKKHQLSPYFIVIRYELRKLDIDNGKELSKQIKNEKIIFLR